MLKVNCFKKAILIAMTVLTPTSLFFASNFVNQKSNVVKKFLKEPKIVSLKNTTRDLELVCETMEENETWLKVNQVKTISGASTKFNAIDFTDLKDESNPSINYELKVFAYATPSDIFDYANLTYVELGSSHWITFNNLLNNINLPEKKLNVNLAKEVFDPIYLAKGWYANLSTLKFKEININIEENKNHQNLIGLSMSQIEADLVNFRGPRMALDVGIIDSELNANKISNSKINEILFIDVITGINFEYFNKLQSKTEEKTKLILLKCAQKVNLWSYYKKQSNNQTQYNMDCNLDIYIYNHLTDLQFLKYKPADEEIETDWFWSLLDTAGKNKTTLNITQPLFDEIQRNEKTKAQWDMANQASQARVENSNDVPWYRIVEDAEPRSISSELLKPDTSTVYVNKYVDFVLTFTVADSYKIIKDKIKIVQKGTDGDSDRYLPEEDYSISLDYIPNFNEKKYAYVKFKKEIEYEKIAFNYLLNEHETLRDQSDGVNLKVVLKFEIFITSSWSFDWNIRFNEKIEVKLTSTKNISWFDSSTGIKLTFTDEENHEVDYAEDFDFTWINDSITNLSVKFMIQSKKQHFNLKKFKINVVKIDDSSINDFKTIKFYDDMPPEPGPNGVINFDIIEIAGYSIAGLIMLINIIAMIIYFKKNKK